MSLLIEKFLLQLSGIVGLKCNAQSSVRIDAKRLFSQSDMSDSHRKVFKSRSKVVTT